MALQAELDGEIDFQRRPRSKSNRRKQRQVVDSAGRRIVDIAGRPVTGKGGAGATPDGRRPGPALAMQRIGIAGRVDQRREPLHAGFLRRRRGRLLERPRRQIRLSAVAVVLLVGRDERPVRKQAPLGEIGIVAQQVESHADVTERRIARAVGVQLRYFEYRRTGKQQRPEVENALRQPDPLVELVNEMRQPRAQRADEPLGKGRNGAQTVADRGEERNKSVKLGEIEVPPGRHRRDHVGMRHQPDQLPERDLVGDHRAVGIGGKVQVARLDRGHAVGGRVGRVLQLHLFAGENPRVDQRQADEDHRDGQQQDQYDGLSPLPATSRAGCVAWRNRPDNARR